MNKKTEKFFYNPYAHPDYWDCRCQHDYIHKKIYINEFDFCCWCNAQRINQPDSILEEVNRYRLQGEVRK